MTSTVMQKVGLTLAMLGVLVAGNAGFLLAQDGNQVDDDHHFHHHHVGVLVGGMTPLSETSETSFALGAEYEYRFNEKWGTGLGVDLTFGDHKRAALVATGVSYRVTPAFKVATGPGVEWVEKDKSGGGTTTKPYFLWGFMFAYDFHVGSLTLSPTLYVDFVGETKTNLAYGIAIGTGF